MWRFWIGRGRASAMSWVKAVDLKPGDRLILAETDAAARVVALSADEGLSTVYNFAVDVDHTYFVGATKVWVHNIYTVDAEQSAKAIDERFNFRFDRGELFLCGEAQEMLYTLPSVQSNELGVDAAAPSNSVVTNR